MLKKILLGLTLVTSFLTVPVHAANSAFPTIKATMLLEHEGFLMWYAKKMGWDKELGIEVDLTILNTNDIEIMDRHREDPSSWDITAVSSIPLIIGSKDMPLEIIAIANDASATTGVYVPKDSDLLSFKGWNSDFPNVYGSPESLEGKTFLIKNLTSSAYMLAKYLEIFNMDFHNIVISDTQISEAVEELNQGNGDGTSIRSPYTYHAQLDNMVRLCSAQDINEEIPLMIMADRNYSKEHEDMVAKFLAVYMRAVEAQIADYRKLIPEYKAFYKEFTGEEFNESFLANDLKSHHVIDLDDQMGLFERKGNRKSTIQKLEATIASSLMLILYDSSNSDFCSTASNVKNPRYVTDKYLKMANRILKNVQQ